MAQGIAKDLVTAQTSGVDLTKIQLDIDSKKSSITSTADAATFNGVNWLAFDDSIQDPTPAQNAQYGSEIYYDPYHTWITGSAADPTTSTIPDNVSVLTSINSDGSASSTQFDISKLQIYAPTSTTPWWNYGSTVEGAYGWKVAAIDVTGASSSQLTTFSKQVDGMISAITTASSLLGGLQNLVDGSKQTNSAIITALTSGVGSLVDADMNQVSTRLNALQTQQQLGMQSLSIANDNAKMVMKLFGS